MNTTAAPDLSRHDCSPRYECIIGQTYIGDIWVYSNTESTHFVAEVMKQFVGIMHAGTDHETTWTEETPGWIEDGLARKGETISTATFDSFEKAFEWLQGETRRLLAEIYGSLNAQDMAV